MPPTKKHHDKNGKRKAPQRRRVSDADLADLFNSIDTGLTEVLSWIERQYEETLLSMSTERTYLAPSSTNGSTQSIETVRLRISGLRSLAQAGATVSQARSAGGLKTALQRQQEALARELNALHLWKLYKEACSYSRANIVQNIAERCEVTDDTARQWVAAFENGETPELTTRLRGGRRPLKIKR